MYHLPKAFNEVKFFSENNINIIKMSVGNRWSFFLDGTGVVWACGVKPILGLGESDDDEFVHTPTEVKYFKENEIRIKDIKCGDLHIMAYDVNGNVYSWGSNRWGQCGHGDTHHRRDNLFFEPTRIEYFDGYIVDKIGCGEVHSYVGTECGRHYLFGCNDDNECMTFDGNEIVSTPHRFDEIIKKKYDIKEIVNVMPTFYSTKLFCIAK